MGDRSNIVIQDGEDRIYLYSHWRGQSAISAAVHGLRSGRVGDPAYLARIIFSNLVKNDLAEETGYGISTRIQDNEHPIFVIDGDTGNVWFEDEEGRDRITAVIDRESFLASFDIFASDYSRNHYEGLYERLIEEYL